MFSARHGASRFYFFFHFHPARSLATLPRGEIDRTGNDGGLVLGQLVVSLLTGGRAPRSCAEEGQMATVEVLAAL